MDEASSSTLANYLRQQRQRRQLSAAELARRIGVPTSTITRIEAGLITAPKAETLRAMAEELGLPVREVLTRANYLAPNDLPALAPYLRAKYRELPLETVEQMERYFSCIARKHGYQPEGPAPGEDEY